MPQLSLYIDDDTLSKLETGAKISNTSVSKFVSLVLRNHFAKSWPDGFQNLFGSISDDDLIDPEDLDFSADTRRERL